jgi:hypothetical protein
MKHSLWEASIAGGTPVVVLVNSARQQYWPAALTVAGGEITSPLVDTLFDPTSTPPVAHVAVVDVASSGPHRWNWMVPLNSATPVTVRFALSVTEIWALFGSVGIGNGPAFVGVVVSVVSHLPNPPSTKSFRVAVGEVDARDSAATAAKHVFPRPSSVRLTPPS